MGKLVIDFTKRILYLHSQCAYSTAQKMRFYIKNFFSKCDQICWKLRAKELIFLDFQTAHPLPYALVT